MKSIMYTKPSDQIGSMTVTMSKAIHNHEADMFGIICGTGTKKARVVPWSVVAHCLAPALAVSPKLRADLRAMIDAAELLASQPEATP